MNGARSASWPKGSAAASKCGTVTRRPADWGRGRCSDASRRSRLPSEVLDRSGSARSSLDAPATRPGRVAERPSDTAVGLEQRDVGDRDGTGGPDRPTHVDLQIIEIPAMI